MEGGRGWGKMGKEVGGGKGDRRRRVSLYEVELIMRIVGGQDKEGQSLGKKRKSFLILRAKLTLNRGVKWQFFVVKARVLLL
jgi:hypothetical protein